MNANANLNENKLPDVFASGENNEQQEQSMGQRIPRRQIVDWWRTRNAGRVSKIFLVYIALPLTAYLIGLLFWPYLGLRLIEVLTVSNNVSIELVALEVIIFGCFLAKVALTVIAFLLPEIADKISNREQLK